MPRVRAAVNVSACRGCVLLCNVSPTLLRLQTFTDNTSHHLGASPQLTSTPHGAPQLCSMKNTALPSVTQCPAIIRISGLSRLLYATALQPGVSPVHLQPGQPRSTTTTLSINLCGLYLQCGRGNNQGRTFLRIVLHGFLRMQWWSVACRVCRCPRTFTA